MKCMYEYGYMNVIGYMLSVVSVISLADFMGARPETEKIVVDKWCYFPELYKMTEVREEGKENG